MKAPAASSQDVFDIRKIRRLVELMKEHDLAELDLQQGEVRIQLRRGTGDSARALPAHAAHSIGVGSSAPSGPPAPESVALSPAETKAGSIAIIKSPMVGTFYTASDPDSPAYVKVGDHVGAETTVCIVEAMKVFNQIPAEVSGRIVAILAENGAPVEFGQPLFKVDTRE
jgi:acetyl-CoA carboxylase biotin carboxyl carrier protein